MNYSQLGDNELAKRVQEDNCSDSIVELTKRHKGLLVQMSKKYANVSQCSGIALSDFLDDAQLIVFNAASTFKPEMNIKFATWLGNKARYHCLNTLNSQTRYYNPPTETEIGKWLADTLSNEEEEEKSARDETLEYVMNILSQMKDERIKTIISRRYFNGSEKKTSFSVIAKELSMSTQGVIDLHNSFIKFVGEKIRSSENMDEI